MTQELQNYQNWFSIFNDGTDEEAIAQFELTFSKDLLVIGKDYNYSYNQWLDICLKMRKNGVKCYTTVNKVEEHNGQVFIYYYVKIHLTDQHILELYTKGIFQNGKYIKSEPTNPEMYDKMAIT